MPSSSHRWRGTVAAGKSKSTGMFDAEALIIVRHARFNIPQASEHSARPRRTQRARPWHSRRVAGKIDVDIETIRAELQNRFTRTQAAADAVERIFRH